MTGATVRSKSDIFRTTEWTSQSVWTCAGLGRATWASVAAGSDLINSTAETEPDTEPDSSRVKTTFRDSGGALLWRMALRPSETVVDSGNARKSGLMSPPAVS